MSANTPLTLVEEATLLALDDQTGSRRPMPALAYDYLLAGALLSDLAVANRIDTDLKQATVLTTEPTGDPLLDYGLTLITADTAVRSTSALLEILVKESYQISDLAIDRLIDRGVLKRQSNRLLWVLGLRRYPTVDNTERMEVLTRLGTLILNEDIPDPHDAILISLITGCQLTHNIFTGPSYESRRQRLSTLASMDLVGREVGRTVNDIIMSMNRAITMVGIQ